MRYVVTEIEGDWMPRVYGGKMDSARHGAGLSVHVLDVPYNRRVVFTARTEDLPSGGNITPRTNDERRAEVREAAATRCDLLNRLDEIARQAQGAVA